MERKIETGQKKRIWGCASALRISKDRLYDRIRAAYSVDHMGDLSYYQASRLINDMEREVKNAKRTRIRNLEKSGVRSLEKRQRKAPMDAKMDALVYRLRVKYPDLTTDAMSMRIFKTERKNLDVYEGQKLIEILKKMCRTHGIEIYDIDETKVEVYDGRS